MNNEEAFYQATMRRQGVTRRSFLKYCSLAATSLGLGAGMAPKIALGAGEQTAHSGGMDPRPGMHLLYRIFYPLRTHWRRTSSFPYFSRLRRYFDGCRRETRRKKSLKTSSRNTMANILRGRRQSPLGEQDVLYQQRSTVLLRNKRAAAGASAIIA